MRASRRILVAASLLHLAACTAGTPPLQRALARAGLPLQGIDRMRLEESASPARPGRELILATDGRSYLRVEAWHDRTREEALEEVRRQHAIVRSAYRSLTSPYVAHLTREIGCPAAFLPRTFGEGRLRFVSTPVTARLAYGACSPAEAAYAGALFFVYDSATRSAFKIELFIPLGPLGPTAGHQAGITPGELEDFVRANTLTLENIT